MNRLNVCLAVLWRCRILNDNDLGMKLCNIRYISVGNVCGFETRTQAVLYIFDVRCFIWLSRTYNKHFC
ncbi:hypothetical protein RIR_jg24765.t1 [Rhizophagus irregularis DAOM 181602=DAOM 197198]|uniref:Uncharacterized protein n=1 Tax=Rhizophagus irregularis (strain DAOM 181602 / DAOM 197198 / MUCL 43194) TaxID=747089 RepID=U9THF8_RHIID|nr:hypothetical protein RIR_jg24765.t1 [Rhizophagus irregularis DAOM 181602=DAOM 197198]